MLLSGLLELGRFDVCLSLIIYAYQQNLYVSLSREVSTHGGIFAVR